MLNRWSEEYLLLEVFKKREYHGSFNIRVLDEHLNATKVQPQELTSTVMEEKQSDSGTSFSPGKVVFSYLIPQCSDISNK